MRAIAAFDSLLQYADEIITLSRFLIWILAAHTSRALPS